METQDRVRQALFAQRKRDYVPTKCRRCETKGATLIDAFGGHWCMTCSSRFALIQWGATHGFPFLHCPPYAIASGQYFWLFAAMIGTDAYIEMALAATQQHA